MIQVFNHIVFEERGFGLLKNMETIFKNVSFFMFIPMNLSMIVASKVKKPLQLSMRCRRAC